MGAHVWFEGNFVLLLHGTAILSTAYDKRLIFSVKQLSIKSGMFEKYSKVGINWIAQCWYVYLFLFRTLLHRYISSKVKPSFVEDIKIAGFGGVRQYIG